MTSIIIVGASTDRNKFGNKAVRAFRDKGFTVYPVNPNESEIEGIPAFRSVADVPAETVDLVSIYLPPRLGLQVLEALPAKQPREVWLNPGAESGELLQRAEALGLNAIAACSLVAHGLNPYNY